MVNMEYEDCFKCSLKYCQLDCFDKYEGSRIALGKLINEANDKKNIKVHIAGDIK